MDKYQYAAVMSILTFILAGVRHVLAEQIGLLSTAQAERALDQLDSALSKYQAHVIEYQEKMHRD